MKRLLSIVLFVVLAINSFLMPFLINGEALSDINLALSKNYTIEYESPIENGFPLLVQDDTVNKLTDGKRAAASEDDDNWLILYRGTSIIITVDLGGMCAVKDVKLGQLQAKAMGIYTSRYLHASVSEDGVNFGTVGSLFVKNSITQGGTKRITNEIDFGKYYRARYVRIVFSSDVWTYTDEIEVFGLQNSGVGDSVPSDPTTEYRNSLATDVDGLHNILLMYCGKYVRGRISEIGMNTYEELLPYFAYVDKNGLPVDTMFESMLFLPIDPGSTEGSFSHKNGWQYYLDNVIGANDNINLTALNRLVGDYKEQFNLGRDYTYSVYISVPYINISSSSFGVIDGQTVVPNDLAGRVRIIKWFIDSVIAAFASAGLENIQLNGFYWHHELVPYHSSNYEDALIKSFTTYAREKGYSSIWIPYYLASGFETWEELGFDAAVLQSGYAFIGQGSNVIGEKLPSVVDDSLMMAKKYGLGMEIETSGRLMYDPEGLYRYKKYIHSAYINGLMENGLTIFYQDGGPGVYYNCAYSSGQGREGYELTYSFLKGTYSTYIPAFDDDDRFIIIKQGEQIEGVPLIATGVNMDYYGKEYTIVVKGDVNGDGNISSADFLLTKRAYLGTYTLTETQLKAACIENTLLPTAKDYLKIKRHFLGTYCLHP